MLLSKFFLPLLKDKPVEASIISHALMLKSGMIRQHAAGIYNWLPLGLRVLKNIENIVRYNMNSSGFIEMLMPCVQSSELWSESGRFNTYGKEMLKFKDRHSHDLLFGPTHEEVFTDIVRNSIQSYKDLPKVLYQIQWKFRDEIRPRFGLMRCREFLMKDAYSLDVDEKGSVDTYKQIFAAYMRTFHNLGLLVIPLAADTGEIGGSLSHEFHVVADTGESILYYDKKFEYLKKDQLVNDLSFVRSLYAVTEEKHDPANCPISKKDLSVKRGIEVGHIFNFGQKYSKPMGASVNNKEGQLVPIHMGSYGIGISRLVAAIIEVSHDEKGIIWPVSVAPFKVSIINLNIDQQVCKDISYAIYDRLVQEKIDVLLDDTIARPGTKFATHDLIGSPWQIIIGPKKAQKNLVELKNRKSGNIKDIETHKVTDKIIELLNVQ